MTEQKIWSRGVLTWQQFLDHGDTILSPERDAFVGMELETSLAHRDDISFFSDRLSMGERWRLFNAFKDRAVYLDIETTGLLQGADDITVIGIYDGIEVQTFVNGINLNDFEIAIANYDLVITFNGATFDLPFIRRWLPGISLPPAHIDLRSLMKKLGYTGGLKRIERALGIARERDIEGIDGYEAVRLWQAYQWGDDAALETLIRYNRADIVNLKPLLDIGYSEMKRRLFGLD